MAAGTRVAIVVLGNPETATQAGVIRNVVESFTAEVQRRQLAASVAIQTLQQSGAVPPQRMQEAVQSVLDEVGTSQQTGTVSVKTTTQEGLKVPRALDYYAVGMALAVPDLHRKHGHRGYAGGEASAHAVTRPDDTDLSQPGPAGQARGHLRRRRSAVRA